MLIIKSDVKLTNSDPAFTRMSSLGVPIYWYIFDDLHDLVTSTATRTNQNRLEEPELFEVDDKDDEDWRSDNERI